MPGDEIHAATAATIAAIGSAERYELLATERNDSVSAIPSFYPDACFVDVNRHAVLTI